MNLSVILFFLHNVLATVLLGGKFVSKRDSVIKNFGIALLLDGVAFAAWTFGILSPTNLLSAVTIGAIFFLVSLVFMFRASTESTGMRWSLTILGIVVALGIFYFGHIATETAYISPEGLVFFNLGPMVQMLYIFGLMLASLPAIEAIASKFKSWYAALFRYGFIIQIAGAIMLITSKDSQALYIVGWIIGLSYFLLWTTLLFSKKAWSTN